VGLGKYQGESVALLLSSPGMPVLFKVLPSTVARDTIFGWLDPYLERKEIQAAADTESARNSANFALVQHTMNCFWTTY
jgi:hypothetical protein